MSDAGLVTIAGGKWTTYRKMAADTVDRAADVAGLERVDCPTEELRLHGWTEEADEDDPLAVYGAEAARVRNPAGGGGGADAEADGGELLHPDLPYRRSEIAWAARHEMARTVDDVLARRTRALLLDARAAIEAAPRAARILARELGRDETWVEAQVADFEAIAAGYLPDGAPGPA